MTPPLGALGLCARDTPAVDEVICGYMQARKLCFCLPCQRLLAALEDHSLICLVRIVARIIV